MSGRSDSNTVMITQHKYLTTHDNRGDDTRAGHLITFPQRKRGFVSGTREEAMPIAMQTDRGRHAGCCQPSTVLVTGTEQNKQEGTEGQPPEVDLRRGLLLGLGVTSAARWHVH